MKKILYPASFDPPTYGHMNVIEQAEKLFDEIVLAVMKNPSKKESYFTTEERVAMLKEIYKDHQNIKVVSGGGLAVDLALLYDCQALLRGLRGVSDFDYELQLATFNRELAPNISTICLFPASEVQHLSSSSIKDLHNLGKDIGNYVHPVVKKKMLEKNRGKKC